MQAVSRSFDYGGKNAAFAQDDRVWGRWKERRIAYAMAHLSDDETVAKMGHPALYNGLNRMVETGLDVSVVRAVSRSFDYGGKKRRLRSG